MFDYDLAKLYQCKNGTKEINQAVKNNIEKFPERFSFRLSENEMKNFLVKKFDQKIETRGGRYKNPRVFTEQGIAMLSTIIKSPIAIQTSIQIMDAFVLMRKYISNNLLEQKYINNMVLKNNYDIRILQKTFEELNNKQVKSHIFFAGQIYDAYSKIIDIIKMAQKKIIIIDNYSDKIVLDIISKIETKVVLIIKNNQYITKIDIEKYYDIKQMLNKFVDFKQLKNEELFKKVKVDAGGYAISWNENIDLSCNELWYNGIEKI